MMKPLKELISEKWNKRKHLKYPPATLDEIAEDEYKAGWADCFEELSKSAGEASMKCFMKSKQGENDYLMFINEHPEGGFKWSFLDYEPDNIADYTPIYITREDQGAIIQSQRLRIEELERVVNEIQVVRSLK